MYRIIDKSGNTYVWYAYTKEEEFEQMVVSNADAIFGKDGIYFNIKKRIGTPKKGASIPDGYYLDLTFHDDPQLYLVEIELNSHDVYGHIGEQILRFGISSESDKYKIKQHLLQEIHTNTQREAILADFFSKSKFNNPSELFDRVIFDKKPAAIIVIDEATPELAHVMAQLTMATEVLEFQTYICGDQRIHRFTPFKDDVLADLTKSADADELDTIVVPARDEGFEQEFIRNERWYAIRISSAMLGKIKYIAAYQVAPVSGVTHIAEVDKIEKYKDSNKYILYFRAGSLQKINKIGLGNKKGQAPQAPRYTSYKTLMKARTLDDLWSERTC